jgi:hypothetical protein
MRKMSITEIQEIPARRLILLAGTPGAGKSTFCHQMVLNSMAAGRPIIFVITEQSPSDIAGLLRERGMTEAPSGMLNFVYLTAMDSAKIERIEHRLMEQVTEFVIHRKTLEERPRLGSGVFTHHFLNLPGLASERYRMALRMGGAKAGKEIGEQLMNAGLREDEVIRCVLDFMEYCRVGKITLGETMRMKENCESFGLETGEPTSFFTTSFLNGLFSAVKNQHVREIKCVAAGDPFCEWEFR